MPRPVNAKMGPDIYDDNESLSSFESDDPDYQEIRDSMLGLDRNEVRETMNTEFNTKRPRDDDQGNGGPLKRSRGNGGSSAAAAAMMRKSKNKIQKKCNFVLDSGRQCQNHRCRRPDGKLLKRCCKHKNKRTKK